MREPLEDRYEGFRRKEYEPLGYLSKLFPSLIPLSVLLLVRLPWPWGLQAQTSRSLFQGKVCFFLACLVLSRVGFPPFS